MVDPRFSFDGCGPLLVVGFWEKTEDFQGDFEDAPVILIGFFEVNQALSCMFWKDTAV